MLNDLSVRRGLIICVDNAGAAAMGSRGNIRSEVPLVHLCDYSTVLRSLTAGGGDFTMSFLRYRAIEES